MKFQADVSNKSFLIDVGKKYTVLENKKRCYLDTVARIC